MSLVRPDQAHELAMPVQRGPQACAFRNRRLAAAARHGHRKQSPVQHRPLDLRDHLQVVLGPRVGFVRTGVFSGGKPILFEIKTETFRFPNHLSGPKRHVSDR